MIFLAAVSSGEGGCTMIFGMVVVCILVFVFRHNCFFLIFSTLHEFMQVNVLQNIFENSIRKK